MLKEQKKYKKKIQDEENVDYLTTKKESVDSIYQGKDISRSTRSTNLKDNQNGGNGVNGVNDDYYQQNATMMNTIHEFHTNTDNMYNMIGGESEQSIDNDESEDDEESLYAAKTEEEKDVIESDIMAKKFDEMTEDELDDIEKIYQDMDANIDKDAIHTSKLIKDALKDDAIFKKTNADLLEFDTSKDTNMYDEQLKNVLL